MKPVLSSAIATCSPMISMRTLKGQVCIESGLDKLAEKYLGAGEERWLIPRLNSKKQIRKKAVTENKPAETPCTRAPARSRIE